MPCLCMSLTVEMFHMPRTLATTCVLGKLGSNLNSCNIRSGLRRGIHMHKGSNDGGWC